MRLFILSVRITFEDLQVLETLQPELNNLPGE